MDLIFFDLDGTLLNQESQISPFTKETLLLLGQNNIAYTVATGRTLLSAQPIIDGHSFDLPQVYNNGVTIWDPRTQEFTLDNLLTRSEVFEVVELADKQTITPFVHAIDERGNHSIFFSQTQHEIEEQLVQKYYSRTDATLQPLNALPAISRVTNISMIGDNDRVYDIWQEVNVCDNLIAYSGPALEGDQFSWMDVHHRQANKGSAVSLLKSQLGASNVICFGDSDNDLSMFALADESYAPDNARPEIKQSASAVIGHHHGDGIAHFLRERFSL